MKASLVLQPLAAARWTLAALAAGLVALMLVATSTYEAFGGAQVLSQFVNRMPRGMRTMLGGENLLTPAGYFSTIFFHPLLLVFQGGAAIALVTRLAQDVETHAVELLLSRPVTRVELALARYLAALAGVAAVIACGAVAFLCGRALTPAVQELEAMRVIATFGYDLLLWAAITSVGFVATCLSSARGQAVSWAVGFAALSYLVNVIGQLWKPMDAARRASVFYYFRPGMALAGSPPPAGYLALLAGVAVAGVLLGLYAFRRRDIG
jgi:ABC-type transport system involved in multi-copper enzyme maturation permease subunit